MKTLIIILILCLIPTIIFGFDVKMRNELEKPLNENDFLFLNNLIGFEFNLFKINHRIYGGYRLIIETANADQPDFGNWIYHYRAEIKPVYFEINGQSLKIGVEW